MLGPQRAGRSVSNCNPSCREAVLPAPARHSSQPLALISHSAGTWQPDRPQSRSWNRQQRCTPGTPVYRLEVSQHPTKLSGLGFCVSYEESISLMTLDSAWRAGKVARSSVCLPWQMSCCWKPHSASQLDPWPDPAACLSANGAQRCLL